MLLRKFLPYLALICATPIFSQNKIAGKVTDQTTGEALYGATVFDKISGKGAVTNNYGFYVFTTDSATIDLQVSFVGYQPKSHEGRSVYATQLDFALSSSIDLNTVEIIAERTPLKAVGTKMDHKFIKHVPAFLGENDVLRSAQFIPGIQSAGDGATGLVVRGGSPDQNLILLDGVPIYNAFHVMGLFSVFNPEMIQNTYILKGAFPARYGGRLSSVMDIQTKEGSREKLNGSVGLGPLVSHVFVEGPIGDKKQSSFVISGRRTFMDILMKPFIYAASEGEASGGFHFHDFNAKYNITLDPNNQLYASVYLGKDRFGFKTREEDGYQEKASFGWGNNIGMVRWNHRSNSGVFMNLNLYYSDYKFATGFEFKEPDETYKEGYHSGIRDLAIKANWESSFYGGIARWGAHQTFHEFSPGIIEISGDGLEIFGDVSSNKIMSSELIGYGEWEKPWTKKIKSNIGLNSTRLSVENKQYLNFDPRLKVSYLPKKGELFLGYSRLTQTLHLLTNPAISLPTDIWITSTDVLKPARANEISAGYLVNVNGFELEFGAYGKTINNVVEVKEGEQIFVLIDDWESKLKQGKGYSYGAEFGARKSYQNLDLSFGLTYSRSFRKIEGVDNNEYFPYKYDRPIYLTQTGLWNFAKNKSFSWAFTLASGYRFTAPRGSYFLGSNYQGNEFNNWYANRFDIEVYSDRNGEVMPIYHRLDIAYESKKVKKKGERIWKIGLTNAYNRVNPIFVDTWGLDLNESNKADAYGLIPILPSFKWTRTF
ncbi:TonB-dependent receptor [Luteibaculum oceani]|uniref:TonB-dependent receptor n=1 Tax=Luteibaculum oceani TaxID=1294296 RepID=A0A5C6V9F3_9FLAO|nr:carboxypeptidase-like regulatory domain-containing protein [Luteibaculum oceani]TXC81324.1 TonB-dependent receptor [Luteibaculum oceani]